MDATSHLPPYRIEEPDYSFGAQIVFMFTYGFVNSTIL